MPTPPAQLIVYAFGPDARFEGQLVGALERIETGGAVRVLRALMVSRDPETGDLVAFEQEGNGAGGFVSSALAFRLDDGERERATQRALDGPAGDSVRAMGEKLEPGGTLAAIFVSHVWADGLADAAARVGGTLVSDDYVDPDALTAALGR